MALNAQISLALNLPIYVARYYLLAPNKQS